MDHVTPRLLAIWLIGALALSLAVVGCGTITSQDPPANALAKYESSKGSIIKTGRNVTLLTPCAMSNGGAGLKFDDLCLPAPPAGWTGEQLAKTLRGRPKQLHPGAAVVPQLQPASFLTLPDGRPCRSSITATEPLAA